MTTERARPEQGTEARPTLLVGAAAEVVTPAPGGAMGGYASRTAGADGVLDDLYCRVVIVDDGSVTLALVVFDLLYVRAVLADAVAAAVASVLGAEPEHVMVTATHTHGGPAIAGPGSDVLDRSLTEAATRCAASAHRTRIEATLHSGAISVAGLVHHRRHPAGEVDDDAAVLLALAAGSGEVIATVVTMACHPTILVGDTLAFSRDYPGAVCDTIESLVGGHAVFLQGFAGDVNPLFHDNSPVDMRRFGRLIGVRAADAALSTQRSMNDNRTVNLSRGMTVPVEVPAPMRRVERTALSGRLREVTVEVKAPVDREVIRAELRVARSAVAGARTPSERDTAAAAEAAWWIEDLICDDPPYLGIDLPAGPAASLPVQVLTLGSGLQIVALPGEPLHGAADALRGILGDGPILVGYAHRAASYLPCVADFAHRGYEVGSTRYRPGTVERLVDAAVTMVRDETGSTSS